LVAIDTVTDGVRNRLFDGPVYVYGRGLGNRSFYEKALVLFASAEGGLLLLNMPVCDGQVLLLTNRATMKDRACRVVHVHDRGSGRIEVGFEFSCPSLDFWRLTDSVSS
jgi:hypothetical protein